MRRRKRHEPHRQNLTAPAPLSEAERGEPEGRLIVKQSGPQLRTRQAWFSDVSRIHREEDVQRLLAAALPGQVPQVLFSARDDYAYVMEGGRVSFEGQSSSRWHSAVGGGIWFAFVDRANTFSLGVARSAERTGVYIRSGFLF